MKGFVLSNLFGISNLDGYRGLKEAAAALGRADVIQFAARAIARLAG